MEKFIQTLKLTEINPIFYSNLEYFVYRNGPIGVKSKRQMRMSHLSLLLV